MGIGYDVAQCHAFFPFDALTACSK
jgi:hypothetical protein